MHNWKTTFKKETVRSPQQLTTITKRATSNQAHQQFPTLAPISFLNTNNPALIKQVLPSKQETKITKGFTTDPLQEQAHTITNGLIQKYQSRALITTTGACAIHCRYCFRRHFNYQEQNPLTPTNLQAITKSLADDKTIQEIILSGGDPLMLDDHKLQQLFNLIHKIKHITTIRIHTRVPTVLPKRITQQLINILKRIKQQLVIVLHINHPDELTTPATTAIQQLHQTTHHILNQSVLLKGINDNPETLIQLSNKLFKHHITPYYLHSLDPVKGTSHFQVPLPKAKQIMQTLRDSLPGYLVPKFVKEVPNLKSKKQIHY
ncbi:MAG: KamA family radical SAM protein [Methylacidiphilales bacterium]|nr:KamA family radical SAM protein [Candidatus Methylacidiphilales bacterium]